MITVDLMSDGHYPPLDTRTPQELFELAVKIAQSLDNVCVRVPVSDEYSDTVMLSSKLMRKQGVMLF